MQMKGELKLLILIISRALLLNLLTEEGLGFNYLRTSALMNELNVFNDEYFMRAALNEAKTAYEMDEVPIGAVIVSGNRIIAKGHNMTEKLNDVTAHAEMIAYTAASSYLNSKYLVDCTLFVTIEPCLMCAGAAFWTQISRIVFGAGDEKRGFRRVNYPVLHPTTKLLSGPLEKECSELLRNYFISKR
jgi:tRNA(adenine34) deaminase